MLNTGPEPSFGPRWSRYVDLKLKTSVEAAQSRFGWEYVASALDDIGDHVVRSETELKTSLWPDLARAAIAFLRARLEDEMFPRPKDPFRGTLAVPQLLNEIRLGAEQIVKAAEEIMRQAEDPIQHGGNADPFRIEVLSRLSSALNLFQVPPETAYEIWRRTQPRFAENDLLPDERRTGLEAIHGLRDECVAIRAAYRKGKVTVAGKAGGNRADAELKQFLIELAHLYSWATAKRASAHKGNQATRAAAPSPFLRFAGNILATLGRETILHRPIAPADMPNPTTVARYIQEATSVAEWDGVS